MARRPQNGRRKVHPRQHRPRVRAGTFDYETGGVVRRRIVVMSRMIACKTSVLWVQPQGILAA
jgi:hypothetical protein